MKYRTCKVLIELVLSVIVLTAQAPDSGQNALLKERMVVKTRELVETRPELRQALTLEIQRDLDAHVAATVDPERAKAEEIQQTLTNLLNVQPEDASYGNSPAAWVGDLRNGRSVVVSYMLRRLQGNDAACTIRGYRRVNGTVQLVAETGADFERHGLLTRALPSPVHGELWILAWGNEFTYNGSLIRFRLYSFDGDTFRTLWSPPDLLDAKVQFIPQGFVIEYTDRDRKVNNLPGAQTLREEYTLLADGPALVSSIYPTVTR
jgi:hypothetical protein